MFTGPVIATGDLRRYIPVWEQGKYISFCNDLGKVEYRVDPNKCIGCGFCKGACPGGIWGLIPNTPL